MDCEFLRAAGVQLKVLRLDLVHPDLGGNKWFKLAPNIEAIIAAGKPRVLSFGGAWSNHLRALAAAGRHYGFSTLGFVRGELPRPLNPVLQFAADCGMELRPLSRSDYRRKQDPDFLAALYRELGEHQLLPEGGSNALAVQGCREIADFIEFGSGQQRIIALAAGTGATLAGLLQGAVDLSLNAHILGFSVLKAPGYMARQVQSLAGPLAAREAERWQILEDYHFGGYARRKPELDRFISDFSRESGIGLEPVYTGKLFYGLWQEIRQGSIAPGSEIVAIHTGGCH
ncbi:MAG: pyridoxal-phosphate dependent enzyme [Pseudomonadales bacterium]|nr:pyridoxal-phosphate dependent enzyme [Pseudomonadales bacterium]